MESPTSLQVGPIHYSVEFSEQKIKEHRGTEGACQDWAYASPRKQEIVIDPTLALDRQRECLTHETLHSLLSVSGLQAYLGDQQEAFVDKLAPWLLDLLQRNRGVVAWLQGTAGQPDA